MGPAARAKIMFKFADLTRENAAREARIAGGGLYSLDSDIVFSRGR